MRMKKSHPYHLVINSPWPITTSITVLLIMIGNIMYYNNKILGKELIIGSIISLLISLYLWWEEVIIESTYRGEHTKEVEKNIMIGIILFIISELLLFLSFFYSFFHNSLVPSIELGNIYPPLGIISLDYKSIPLLNTIILFYSGITVTVSQHSLNNINKTNSFIWLFITIIFCIFFTFLQYIEYNNAFFTISDGIYGSLFYSLTGLHAIHMIIASIYLIIAIIRLYFNHFTNQHFLGFSTSAIYLHFCDLVWLVLFAIIYVWAY